MRSFLDGRCLLVLLSALHTSPVNAQLGQDISVSWVAQIASTPVPTLGSYGAAVLAIMVALLIRHANGTKSTGTGSLALLALSASPLSA